MCNHDCNQGRNCDCKPQMEVCPTGTMAEVQELREKLAEAQAEIEMLKEICRYHLPARHGALYNEQGEKIADSPQEIIKSLTAELDKLLAEREERERQEPVALITSGDMEFLLNNGTADCTLIGSHITSLYNPKRTVPLYAHPVPAIPEGWQLVPKEPTKEMREAGRESYSNDGDELNIYCAMLAAAPQNGKEKA